MCKDGEPDGQTQLGAPWGHLLGLDEPIISDLGPYRAAALECLSLNRPTIYTVLVLYLRSYHRVCVVDYFAINVVDKNIFRLHFGNRFGTKLRADVAIYEILRTTDINLCCKTLPDTHLCRPPTAPRSAIPYRKFNH